MKVFCVLVSVFLGRPEMIEQVSASFASIESVVAVTFGSESVIGVGSVKFVFSSLFCVSVAVIVSVFVVKG